MPQRTDRAQQVYIEPVLERDLQDRLSRIEGHVRGIKKMLEEHRDCDEILTQVAGVKAAVSQVAILLLEGHLETCVADALRAGAGEGPVARFRDSLSRVLKQS
ncbi:MAG: metal-sensitive transcriptional regulator [Chloroflexi bacterium]|nr:metal-sensitive transcriptional regulator [Chloroflexota bacterium]